MPASSARAAAPRRRPLARASVRWPLKGGRPGRLRAPTASVAARTAPRPARRGPAAGSWSTRTPVNQPVARPEPALDGPGKGGRAATSASPSGPRPRRPTSPRKRRVTCQRAGPTKRRLLGPPELAGPARRCRVASSGHAATKVRMVVARLRRRRRAARDRERPSRSAATARSRARRALRMRRSRASASPVSAESGSPERGAAQRVHRHVGQLLDACPRGVRPCSTTASSAAAHLGSGVLCTS